MSISIFEIIGPTMIGPSSSHTAGMARIGLMAHSIINAEPVHITLTLHPAIRYTYKGHRADVALIGGFLGIREDDDRIRDALKISANKGITHSIDFWKDSSINPNTVQISVKTTLGSEHNVQGISVGGGSILITQIDGFKVHLTGREHVIVVWSELNIASEIEKIFGTKVESYIDGSKHLYTIKLNKSSNDNILKRILHLNGVTKLHTINPVLNYGYGKDDIDYYKSYKELLNVSELQNKSIAEIAVSYEICRSGKSKEDIYSQMENQLKVMSEACRYGLEDDIKLNFGLTSGKDGKIMYRYLQQENTLSGTTISMAIAYALATMEVNGSMGCVVAAPTAGSCGIVPGCFLSLKKQRGISNDIIIDAMFVAAIIGVIMYNRGASFSGVVGGCQSEIGVSSAIAAAGLVHLCGGNSLQIVQGMAMAIKNLLGLICDPIAGPVEVPCIKRNSVGVVNAFACADMALAGIQSYIPPDEVIDALVNTQQLLPPELKGTAIGGLACTCTAKNLRKKISNGKF